jgi:hypothetical protein
MHAEVVIIVRLVCVGVCCGSAGCLVSIRLNQVRDVVKMSGVWLMSV